MARDASFGQNDRLTWVDRFGIWLSSRQIRRWLPEEGSLRGADLGCGYRALLGRSLLPRLRSLTLVDVSLDPDLEADPRIHSMEGSLPDTLARLDDGSQDLILLISVLEHLEEGKARETLRQVHRILAPGGVALVNVPSWRGKRFLEFSAFRLGLSPAGEMDDHKMYYDVRDLWPRCVEAGFLPSRIRCFRHKFGLNVFAVCKR